MSKKYYRIYNVVLEAYYPMCFETLEDLLRFVAKSQFGFYDCKYDYENQWLDGINMTLNDTILNSAGFYDKTVEKYLLRPYTFVDPWFHIIDLRQYIPEIMFFAKHPGKDLPNELVDFRNGPVPYTGVYHTHRGSIYRHPKTLNEMKQNSDPEYKEYVRPKRRFKNLPNCIYDEKVRKNNKSWKTNSKRKKQWM